MDFRRFLRSPERGLAGGMTCAVWSSLLLLYAADWIFLRMPGVVSAMNSLPILRPRWPHEFLYNYGSLLWLGMAACAALSLVIAFRNRGRRGPVAFNIYVLIGSAGFAFLVRQAVVAPWMSTLGGISAQ